MSVTSGTEQNDVQLEMPRLPFYLKKEDENLRRIARKVYQHDFDPEDILIVGYPRSGTTWLRDIVWLIMNDLDTEGYKISQDDRICGLERYREHEKNNIEYIDTFKKPRILYSQLPAEFLTPNLKKENKVIACFRNPKDTMTSLYHASKSYFKYIPKLTELVGNAKLEEPDFNLVLTYLASGDIDGRPYVNFLREWWETKDQLNIMFSFYEDMHKDTPGCIRKLANFLGKPVTNEQVNKICEITNFDNMKKQSHWDPNNKNRWVANRIRKGKVGDWKNWFSVEHNEWYSAKIQEELGDIPDLKFTYE